MDSSIYDTETKYLSVGILAQLLSDGDWSSKDIAREYVAQKTIEDIQKWDISDSLDMQYSSFAPIFRLLKVLESPASQIWALYTIASFTSIDACDRNKYCAFIAEEGVALIREIQRNPFSSELMLNYCQTILQNITPQ